MAGARPLWRAAALAWGLGLPVAASAVTVTSFPPSIFTGDPADIEAAVGITPLLVEDFEDTALLPGLTVDYEGLTGQTTVPLGRPHDRRRRPSGRDRLGRLRG